jgi:hypothetical protein
MEKEFRDLMFTSTEKRKQLSKDSDIKKNSKKLVDNDLNKYDRIN